MKEVIRANSNLGTAQINDLIADIEAHVAKDRVVNPLYNPFKFGVTAPGPQESGVVTYSDGAREYSASTAKHDYAVPGSGGHAAAGPCTTAEATANQPGGGESNQMEATSAAKRARDDASATGSGIPEFEDADAERDRKPADEAVGDGPRDGV